MVNRKKKGGRAGTAEKSLSELVRAREVRPWGEMECFRNDPTWWVKRIDVKPGARLSLQSHEHRAEHWFAIEGETIAETFKKKGRAFVRTARKTLKPGDTFFVRRGEMHRLSSKRGGSIIECASGPQVAEADIVRYADQYGRA